MATIAQRLSKLAGDPNSEPLSVPLQLVIVIERSRKQRQHAARVAKTHARYEVRLQAKGAQRAYETAMRALERLV